MWTSKRRSVSMQGRLVVCALAAAVSLTQWLAAAAATQTATASCRSVGIGADSECEVNGVTLHYVDWGGRGNDLVLLAGLDDSARVYDELAPLLAKQHHVFAVTRRGFGHSSIPSSGYDPSILARDLRDFLRAIGARHADLVGHSMSGLELTRVAASEPDLVRRLVYLDAATDKSTLAKMWDKDPLGDRNPPAGVLDSYPHLIRWTQQLLKSRSIGIEDNLRQTFDQSPHGLVFRTPKEVDAAVLAAIVADHPDYSAVRTAALAIYSDYRQADQVPPGTSAKVREQGDIFARTVLMPWQMQEKARFKQKMACSSMLELKHTGHYLFLERPQETVAWINSFLASNNPCAWVPGS